MADFDLLELEDGSLSFNGFDDCIVGTVSRPNTGPLLCYGYALLVQKLMVSEGWDRDEAVEFLEHNTVTAWMGGGTPFILHATPIDFHDTPAVGYTDPKKELADTYTIA